MQKKTGTKTTLVSLRMAGKAMRKRRGIIAKKPHPCSKQKHGEQAMQGLKTVILLQQAIVYLRQPQKTACRTNRNLGKIIPKLLIR